MEAHVKQMLKLLMMSVSFLCVFLAFNGTQTIMSSLLPGTLGYWSIACIYIAFTLSSLFVSAAFVIAVTTKWSLFIGGVLYLGFIVANIWPMWATLVPCAIILGVGAAIIWTAQGAYVTNSAMCFARMTGRPPRSSVGMFNGIFFGIFQLSMLIGNIISSLVLSSGDSSSSWSLSTSLSSFGDSSSSGEEINPRAQSLFHIYTAICAVGCFGLLLLPASEEDGESKKKIKNPIEKVIGALVLWKEPRMFLMMPYLLFTGLEQAFVFGDFTKQFVRELHGVQNVGFVMSVFGAVDSICSFILGRVADRIGARWIGYVGAILLAIFLGTICFFRTTSFGETLAAAFMWAALLGVSDACMFSVFCNAAMATLFPDRAEAAFSNVKVFQAGATALMFFLGPLLSFDSKIYIIGGTLLVAVACVVILDLRVYPLRPQTKEKPEMEKEPLVSSDTDTVVNTVLEDTTTRG